MADPFVGEIRIFFGSFAPRGWASCEGQLLPIAQNTPLFALLGTLYGGNGKTNFALPNLRGRAPVGVGVSNGQHFDVGEQVCGGRVEQTNQGLRAAPASPTEQLTKSVDPNVCAVEDMRQLAQKLGESQEQTQNSIKAHSEIINHIKSAASHVRNHQVKSMNEELEDAGASIKALLKTIDALNDSDAVLELQRAIETLTESQEKTHQMLAILTKISGNIENATSYVSKYLSKLKKGEWKDAGSALELLIQTIYELEHIWDTRTTAPDPSRLVQREADSDRVRYEVATRFVGVNFIIAMQGIFPARN